MSFIMTLFILVPMFAPALGQLVLIFAGWRSIFLSFIVLAAGLGFLIGQDYDGSLLPVALGFVSLTTISLLLIVKMGE